MSRVPNRSLRVPELDDDQFVPDELAARLCHASAQTVSELVGGLTLAERANLARFCYRKCHLREVGLAIAATCDEPTLVSAWGRSLGHALYCQSHETGAQPGAARRRAPITLGKMVRPAGALSTSELYDILDDVDEAAEPVRH